MFRQKHTVSKTISVNTCLALSALCLFVSCTPIKTGDEGATETVQTEPPIFSSDEDALKAAKNSYERYFEVSDDIASRGGDGREGISTLVTPEFLVTTNEGFDDLARDSLHTSGRTSVRSTTLQSYVDIDGLAVVTVYACVDVSEVAVLNLAGENVTPADRANYLSLVAEMVSESLTSQTLVMSSNEPWSSASFC